MYWRYGLARYSTEYGTEVKVVEIFYDDDTDKITSYGNPYLNFSNVDEARKMIAQMLKDMADPVIFDDMPHRKNMTEIVMPLTEVE